MRSSTCTWSVIPLTTITKNEKREKNDSFLVENHAKHIGLPPPRPFSAYQTICASKLFPWQRNLEVVLIMFARMFECADKFIAFTPYHFVAFTIILICDGNFHFSLPLFNQHGGTHLLFRIFSNDIPI